MIEFVPLSCADGALARRGPQPEWRSSLGAAPLPSMSRGLVQLPDLETTSRDAKDSGGL